jgi:hypothetical protein
MASLVARRKRKQYCEPCAKVISGGNLAKHTKKYHPKRIKNHEIRHDTEAKPPQCISEWLDFCDIDLSTSGVSWPLDKLDQLPDLRTQTKETYGQCIAWRIFKDERITNLPSLEMVLFGLNVESCNNAWHSNDRIRLTENQFLEWKVQLLERKTPTTRLLNVQVTEEVVKKSVQIQHHAVVRDKVQDFHSVGADHNIEINDATFDISPQGTTTEIRHDSDPHVSTVRGQSDAKLDQPMKLWILWEASENHRLSTCYSDTAAALDRLKPYGYIIQRAGESVMLPANVPYAALSLSSHYLYGQSFYVQGRARDPTTFSLELCASITPKESIERVLTCYKEGMQDPDSRVRNIYIEYFLSTLLKDCITIRRINKDSYVPILIGDNRMFGGVCGLCQYFGFPPQADEDCWESHPL